MDRNVINTECRGDVLKAIAAARIAAAAPGLLSAAMLHDLAHDAVDARLSRLDDADLPGILASDPGLLDWSSDEPVILTLRETILAALADRIRVALEPDLRASLLHGQDAGTFDAAVAEAVSLIRSALAAGKASHAHFGMDMDSLCDTLETDAASHAALIAYASSYLRAAGHPGHAETLSAARDAREDILLRTPT